MNFPTLYVVVDRFIDTDTGERIIGGTETWTAALIDLAKANMSHIVILQHQNNIKAKQIVDDYGDFELITWADTKELRLLLSRKRIKDKGILFLYGKQIIPEEKDLPCILIHHGVGNDGTSDSSRRGKLNCQLVDLRRKYLWFKDARSLLGYYRKFTKVICVDTNIINQFRYAWPMYDTADSLIYLPNWGDILPEERIQEKWNDIKGPRIVVFARRFRFVRGAQLWVDCLRELAPAFPDVEFHCVGFGSYDKHFRKLSDAFQNIYVYSKPFIEMRDIYEKSHISVVPSLWSEGTSLSALESMGAGCAVVASNVGGLGNIILTDVNGLLVQPTVKSFVHNVKYLLENQNYAAEIGMRSYDIVKVGFSRSVWEKRMSEVIIDAVSKPGAASFERRMHYVM